MVVIKKIFGLATHLLALVLLSTTLYAESPITPPTKLKVSISESTEAVISWADINSDITSFRLSIDNKNSLKKMDYVSAALTKSKRPGKARKFNYTFTVIPDSSYTVRVRSLTTTGKSKWSEVKFTAPSRRDIGGQEETPTPVPTQSATTTSTPTITATPTNTPTPVVQTVKLPGNYDFGTIGWGEPMVASILVRTLEGHPVVSDVSIAGNSQIRLLDETEVATRGGIPCNGPMGQFCVIMAELAGSELGTKTATVDLIYSNPSLSIGDVVTSVTLTGNIQSIPTKHTHSFTTVSAKALAAAQGKTVVAYLQDEFAKIAPSTYSTEDSPLFTSYSSSVPSVWKPNWSNSMFDFSGDAWDTHKDGTAITLCHVVFAKHFQRLPYPDPSGTITFTRKDGTIYTTYITKTVNIPQNTSGVDSANDVTVGRLDPCLPSDWTVYPLLDPTDVPDQALYTYASGLKGVPLISTHYSRQDFIRKLSLAKIDGSYAPQLNAMADPLLPSFIRTNAVDGDSGNPRFIYFDNRLVLVSTFTYGGNGSGPFFGSATMQQKLNNAIAALQ